MKYAVGAIVTILILILFVLVLTLWNQSQPQYTPDPGVALDNPIGKVLHAR